VPQGPSEPTVFVPPSEFALAPRDFIGGMVRALLSLCALGCFAWAMSLYALQMITFYRSGVWQSVPAYTVLLSPAAQRTMVQSGDRIRGVLVAVPSWASFSSRDAMVERLKGNVWGLSRPFAWALDAALAFWLFILGLGCLFVREQIGQRLARQSAG
jgi:hypothetical protein